MGRKRKTKATREARPATDPGQDGGGRHRWLYAALLVGISLALFATTLDAGFLFDDHRFAIGSERVLVPFFDLPTLGPRWARTLTLRVDHALFGSAAPGYHVHNLLWLVAAVLLLQRFVARLSGRAGLGFAAALLFAVHPAHVDTVASITNRKEMMCLAFSLLALLGYLRFLETRRLAALGGAAVAFLFAMGSKQVAMALPLAALAMEWLFVPPERRFVLARPRLALPALGVGGVLGVVLLVGGTDFGNLAAIPTLQGYRGEPNLGAFVLTSARVFWRYLALLVWPAGLCADHLVTLSQALDARTLLAWLGFAGYVAGSFVVARRDALLGFGLLWIAFHFAPISNWLPVSYVQADRYLFIPSAGFCLALARAGELALEQVRARSVALPAHAAAVLLGVVALPFAVGTALHLRHWDSEPALWSHTLVCSPDSWRAHLGQGQHLVRSGAHATALPHFERAITLHPEAASPWLGRGEARLNTGDVRGAIADIEHAAALEPERPEAPVNLALIHMALGEWRAALDAAERAIAIEPRFGAAHQLRAQALERLGRAEDARSGGRRAGGAG